MNAWNTLMLILLLVFGLVLCLVIGMMAFDAWREHRQKGSREVRVPRSRGPSVIRTPWGFWYIYSFRRVSETEVHAVMRDRNKRRHELDIHAHELKPANVLQAAFGPSNAMYEYVPGAHAPHYGEMLYNRAKDTGAIHEFKQEAERSKAAAALANTRIKQQANEILEKHVQLEKTKQPVNTGGRR